ncbi:hypothetical protein N8647_00265 [bacterium]|nr:hypothetical protein [bacterium]
MKVELHDKYKMSIFPTSIEHVIPEFKRDYTPGSDRVLSFDDRDCEQWYHGFVDLVISQRGKKFLPICRLSDGEYMFYLGEQPLDITLPFFSKIRQLLGKFKHQFLLGGGIGAFTQNHYHSGQYSKKEWKQAQIEIPSLIKKISEKGILALHLNYTNEPFQERYFPALEKWIIKNKILVNSKNYYPFYFVYALLNGSRSKDLYKEQRVLIIHGERGEKKQKIINGVKKRGAAEVLWCSISLKRSLFDIIDIESFIGKVDFCLVGAGIGKPKILLQLEPLGVPCIDAGFAFEVLADDKNKWERVCSGTDEDWKKEL